MTSGQRGLQAASPATVIWRRLVPPRKMLPYSRLLSVWAPTPPSHGSLFRTTVLCPAPPRTKPLP